MSYREVKSQFIKKLIEGTSWENEARKEYIDSLIKLEGFILHGAGSMAGAMRRGELQKQYPREWETIYNELKPEEFKDLKERERRENEESERRMDEITRESERREKRLKQEWLEMGGRE